MKNKNFCYLFIISVFFLGCSPRENQEGIYRTSPVLDFVRKGEEAQKEEFEVRRGRIIREVIEEFYSEVAPEGVILAGIGGGINHDNQKKKFIDLSFTQKEPFTISSARYKIVHYVERFLEILNNKDNIQEYLDSYPFDRKNLKISISGGGLKKWESDVVTTVLASRDKVYYWHSEHNWTPVTDLHKETFEEAQRIVNEQS